MIYSLKLVNKEICYDLSLTFKLFQSHYTPFTQIFCLCESMSLIGLSGKLNALKKKDFLHGPIRP